MQVIPAIDLLDGKVVRLHKGEYDNPTVYKRSPLEQAKRFRQAGFNHIHIVDLNGARKGEFVNLRYIKEIIGTLGLSVQTGGGIRSAKDVEKLLDAGLSKVICSSMVFKNREDWLLSLDKYPEEMILGMDLKQGKIAYAGWLESADVDIYAFLNEMKEKGLQTVLCTDISKDGTLEGPNFDLYKDLKTNFPNLFFIASGGVSSAKDLEILKSSGIDACVVGRAYYEGHITLAEMIELHN